MINFIAIDAIYLLGEPMNGYWEMDTGKWILGARASCPHAGWKPALQSSCGLN